MSRSQNQKSQEDLAMVLISLTKPKLKEKTKETKKKEQHKQRKKEKPNKERGKKQEKQNWKSSRAWSFEDKMSFEMLRSLRWESFVIINFTIYVLKNET